MEKIDNKISKKFFVLILLIILLVTSTYAWFTTNKNVRVETLNVKVATSGTLEVSVDAVNWKDSITGEELLEGIHTTYPGAINQIPENEIYPTSTAGNVTNGKMDMFFGTVNLNNSTNEYNLTATKENDIHGTSGKYVAFDMFFKANQETTIYLNSNSNIESGDIINNNPTGIENATRIAILNYGSVSSSAEAQALKEVNNSLIIEPNYDVHTAAGIQNAKNTYEISELKPSGNNALQYYGIKEEILSGRALNDKSDTYFSLVNPDIKLEKSFFGGDSKKELFKLNEGITKIRIYLWIEGQDVDCEDTASGANLKFNLQFIT